MNKKLIFELIVLMILASACAPSSDTSSGDEVGTIVASTMQALTPNVPAPTVETVSTVVIAPTQAAPTTAPSEVIHVSLENVSFDIPKGLASGADAQVVAATSAEAMWDAAPEHFEFTLKDYPVLQNGATKPEINIYPTDDYMAINNGASISVTRLRDILLNSPAVTTKNAPGVPYFNAGLTLLAHSSVVPFNSGTGLDGVVFYAQFPGPIVRDGQFYQFEGLTATGKYFVVAIFPIVSPLQSTSGNLSADGAVYPDFGTAAQGEFEAYYQAMTDKLNAASPDSYQPSLNQLTALMQSLTISNP